MRVKRNEECNFFSPQPEVAMARALLEPYGMIGQPGEANYSSCCRAGVGQNPSEVRRRIDDTKRERIKRGQRDNKSSSSSRMHTKRIKPEEEKGQQGRSSLAICRSFSRAVL